MEVVQQHVALGHMIVRDLPQLELVKAGIRFHHERWDGRGYLDRLEGEQIPLIARLLAVADCVLGDDDHAPLSQGARRSTRASSGSRTARARSSTRSSCGRSWWAFARPRIRRCRASDVWRARIWTPIDRVAWT